jgi:hypothetical protein
MSQEKLTLEHLAAYLPYGVEILQPDAEGRNTFTLDVEGLRIMEVQGFEHFKLKLRPVSDLEHNTPEYLQGCMYSYVQYLLSNHYDVFGLIPKGLAVSIHDIG